MAANKKRDRTKRDKTGQVKIEEAKLRRQIRYLVIGMVLVFVVTSGVIIYIYNENNYVAKVGNQKITKAEYMIIFNQEKEYMLSVFGVPAHEAESFWNTKIEGEYAIDHVKKRALDMAWEYEIQYIKAKDRGIKLTKDEKETIKNLIDGSIPPNLKTTTQKNEYFNNLFGITYREFKDIYTNYHLIPKFIDTIYDEIEVTREDVREFYNDNRDDIDYVTARHILIKTEAGASEEEKQSAKEKAEEILEMVENGEDFESLVSEYSEDPGSRDIGGKYTFTRNESFVEEFKNWAFEHEPGDTGIVETIHGYHVMELLEKKTEFEDLEKESEAALKSKIISDMIEEWKAQPEYRLIRNDKVYNSVS